MKAFIFDFDGVLVDSMNVWAGVVVNLLNEHNVKYPDNLIEIVTPLGNDKIADYLISLGLDMTKEEILKYISTVAVEEYTYNIQAKKDVGYILKKIKEKGCSLNVLTASPHPSVDVCLKRLGFFELFDNVWSCDDFKMSKTNTEIYNSAAKLLGKATSECVFFDDNPGAVETAKKAGLTVVGVFDETSKQFEEKIRKTADYYVHILSEAESFLDDVTA